MLTTFDQKKSSKSAYNSLSNRVTYKKNFLMPIKKHNGISVRTSSRCLLTGKVIPRPNHSLELFYRTIKIKVESLNNIAIRITSLKLVIHEQTIVCKICIILYRTAQKNNFIFMGSTCLTY